MISSEAASSHPIQHPPKFWWGVLLSATALNCAIQIAWFWRFHARNITTDGIAYIGLARHLVDGNFKSSLHGYWSPLSSWLIAAATVFSRDFTLVGRIVTIASFLACLPLLYVLTLKLWDSRTAAALAVFWFSAARGIIATAVGMILADFVLTATVLLYFILLLAALRKNDSRSWISLGFGSRAGFPGQGDRYAMAFDFDLAGRAVAQPALAAPFRDIWSARSVAARRCVGRLGSNPA